MCYSGRCLWEDWQGDCGCPTHELGGFKCECTFEEWVDYRSQITRNNHIQERNIKIKSIKNKLLDKTL